MLKLGNKELPGQSGLGVLTETVNSPTRLKSLFGIAEGEMAVSPSEEEELEALKSQDIISLGIVLLICITGGLEFLEDLEFACPHPRAKHGKSLDEAKSVSKREKSPADRSPE